MVHRRDFLKTASLAAAARPQAATRAERTYVKLPQLAPWEGELGFALEPAVPEWKSEGGGVFSGNGYRLEITPAQPEDSVSTVAFRLERSDGQPFVIHGYSVRVRFSLVGIYRFWSNRSAPLELMEQFSVFMRDLASAKEYEQVYAANSGIPVMLCADREGRNRFTLGLLDQVEAAGLQVRGYSLGKSKRGEGLNYSFEFVKPVGYAIKRSVVADAVYVNSGRQSWFDTVAHYTNWVESVGKSVVLRPPANAYAPIWNTWYPLGQNINQEIVRENARMCRKAGITTLCLDAGYNNALTGGMSNSEEIELFNDHTGDWTADPGKFPDFAGLVEELHRAGHQVTVWVALFMVGKRTRAYQQVRGMLMRNAAGRESTHLCPLHPDTPDYLAQTFLKLAKDYNLDGFWLDFMDSMHVPCSASHPHRSDSPAEGYNRCMAAVRDALLKFKPGFIIETRLKMANINAKRFVNVLETTDMPFDFDLNRGLGVFVRSWSAGVAFKLDPVQWHIRESDENVAKCCATVALAGVPVFGVDFRLLPESHLRVVAAWMQFYQAHRSALAGGRFQPVGAPYLFPQFAVFAGAKTFLYIGAASTAPVDCSGSNELYLVNASDEPRVAVVMDGLASGNWQMVTRDHYLQPVGRQTVQISPSGFLLRQTVPAGGMLELRRG